MCPHAPVNGGTQGDGGKLIARPISKNPLQAFDTCGTGVARVGHRASSRLKRTAIDYGTKSTFRCSNNNGGCGVRASNLELFLNAGVEELHSSAFEMDVARVIATQGYYVDDAEADEYSTLRCRWRVGLRK